MYIQTLQEVLPHSCGRCWNFLTRRTSLVDAAGQQDIVRTTALQSVSSSDNSFSHSLSKQDIARTTALQSVSSSDNSFSHSLSSQANSSQQNEIAGSHSLKKFVKKQVV